MKPIQRSKNFSLIMKKVKINCLICFLLPVGAKSFAQGGKDLILTKDYQMIEANVTLLGDTRIQYKFEGEERINEMMVENIIKIKFSDGKEHVFKTAEKKEKQTITEEYEYTFPPFDKDLVAIIPFNFYDESTGKSIGKSGLEVQEYIERKFINQTNLKVLDARETNARLMKAKVDYTNLDFYPISELSKYLGAGTILTGSVRFIFEEEVFVNQYYIENEPEIIVDESLEINEYGEIRHSTDIYEVSTGGDWYVDFDQYETFQTRTTLRIYEDGKKIFDMERDPLFKWGSQDDWEGNIQWLLMKSPYRLPRND